MAVLTKIDRYLARQILAPTLAVLAVTAMLIMLEKGLRLLELVAEHDGNLRLAGAMLGYLAPEFFSMGIPFALLLGTLAAFHRLGQRCELDILYASGLGPWRLLRVPFCYAAGFLAINFLIIGYVQPLGRHAYEDTRADLISGALGYALKVGEFNALGRATWIYVERSEQRGRALQGIFLRKQAADASELTFTAKSGRVLVSKDQRTFVLRLQSGDLLWRPAGKQSAEKHRPEVVAFDSYDVPFEAASAELRGAAGTAEMTLPELWRGLAGGHLSPAHRTALVAHLHYRAVRVAIILLLPMLALGFAGVPKGGGANPGYVLSAIILITFFKAAQHAERMAIQGRIEPEMALWGVFFAFAALIGWIFRAGGRPGGLPLYRVTRAGAALAARLGAAIGFAPEAGYGRRAPLPLPAAE